MSTAATSCALYFLQSHVWTSRQWSGCSAGNRCGVIPVPTVGEARSACERSHRDRDCVHCGSARAAGTKHVYCTRSCASAASAAGFLPDEGEVGQCRSRRDCSHNALQVASAHRQLTPMPAANLCAQVCKSFRRRLLPIVTSVLCSVVQSRAWPAFRIAHANAARLPRQPAIHSAIGYVFVCSPFTVYRRGADGAAQDASVSTTSTTVPQAQSAATSSLAVARTCLGASSAVGVLAVSVAQMTQAFVRNRSNAAHASAYWVVCFH